MFWPYRNHFAILLTGKRRLCTQPWTSAAKGARTSTLLQICCLIGFVRKHVCNATLRPVLRLFQPQRVKETEEHPVQEGRCGQQLLSRKLLGVLVGDEQALAEGIHEGGALSSKGATQNGLQITPLAKPAGKEKRLT